MQRQQGAPPGIAAIREPGGMADTLSKFELTLYHMHTSRSMRVTWTAAELGILPQLIIKPIALLTGEQNQPSFKQGVNPMAAVPALVAKESSTGESITITESAAICMFLAEQAGCKLQPAVTNAFGRAQYYRMIAFAAASIDAILWDIRLHEQLLPEALRTAHVAQLARRNFARKVIPALEDALEGSSGGWICGRWCEGFTVADVMVGYSVWWARALGLVQESKVICGFLKRVMERAAFREAFGVDAAL